MRKKGTMNEFGEARPSPTYTLQAKIDILSYFHYFQMFTVSVFIFSRYHVFHIFFFPGIPPSGKITLSMSGKPGSSKAAAQQQHHVL